MGVRAHLAKVAEARDSGQASRNVTGQARSHGICVYRAAIAHLVLAQLNAKSRLKGGDRTADSQQCPPDLRLGDGEALGPRKRCDCRVVFNGRSKLSIKFGRGEEPAVQRVAARIHTAQQSVQLGLVTQRQREPHRECLCGGQTPHQTRTAQRGSCRRTVLDRDSRLRSRGRLRCRPAEKEGQQHGCEHGRRAGENIFKGHREQTP